MRTRYGFGDYKIPLQLEIRNVGVSLWNVAYQLVFRLHQ